MKAKKLDKGQTTTLSSSSSSLASSSTQTSSEVFHYICFVPINDHLYELDGLKPHPIDHGLIDKNENWTEKFKQIIIERINLTGSSSGNHSSSQTQLFNHQIPLNQQQQQQQSHNVYSNVQSNGYVNINQQNTEIRFNLMALAPDKFKIYRDQLEKLTANRTKLLDTIENLIKSEPADESIENKSFTSTTEEPNDTLKNTQPNTRQLRSRTSSNQLNQSTVNVNTSTTSSSSKVETLCADNSFKFKIKLENECYFSNDETNDELFFNDFEIERQLTTVETNNNNNGHHSNNENSNAGADCTFLVDSNSKQIFKFKDLVDIEKKIQNEIQYYESKCKEEVEKRNKYKVSHTNVYGCHISRAISPPPTLTHI